MKPVQSFRSLYIHVPFCAVRCDYCAFYTLAGGSDALRERYLERLGAELREIGRRSDPLEAIFVGGGTPTHLTPRELRTFFEHLRGSFTLSLDCEFTMEGNPLSLTPEKLRIMRDGGVNRISLGVESLNASTRDALGRPGAPGLVRKAVERIRGFGFPAMNLDLIYGIEGQTLADWEADLRAIAAFAPDHVSMYALSVEPETPLAERGGSGIDDDAMAACWDLGRDLLASLCGLDLYEISNFCKPGFGCRHNVDIWRGGAFAGAGPSACWYDGTVRWQNRADITRWLAGEAPLADPLPARERAFEVFCTGLRLSQGWQRRDFRERTGFDYQDLCGPSLERLANLGVLDLEADLVRVPAHNLLLHQGITRELDYSLGEV